VRNHIRALREAQGWSQADLGMAVGVTRQAILAIEKDKHDPSVRLAARIAHALKASIDDTFDLDDRD
jgi:putative transcriptional regulator